VTIIGGAFLTLSSLRFLFDVLGWLIWKTGDVVPVVSFFLPRGASGPVPVDWILRHFPTVVAIQGTVAACVATISFQFLRLRPWARPALEVVAWVALGVSIGLAVAFGVAASRFAGAPNARGLAGPIFALIALALLLGAAIRTMRSPDVRAAFRRAPAP
jgi:hypothetical protein